MLLIHANYLDEDFRLVQGDIEIEDGKILRVGKDLPRKEEDLAVDCAGSYTVVPGFVDVHIHGCAGADTCDATREALEAMAAFLLAHGVTSFCPTTMTTSRETIQAALLAAKDMMDHPMEGGARVVGDELAKAIVDAFFGATFVGGRHQNRLNLIAEQEAEYCKPETL